MVVDILMIVDTKEARMFGKKQLEKRKVRAGWDHICAAELRDEALFKAAKQGPRF
jgi:hypothetical protein